MQYCCLLSPLLLPVCSFLRVHSCDTHETNTRAPSIVFFLLRLLPHSPTLLVMTAYGDPTSVLIGAGIIAALTISVTIRAAYNLYLSPLSRSNIPGPTIAAATDAWFDYQALKLNRVRAIHHLFQVRSYQKLRRATLVG